jgi:ABC-type enterochelin transport system ATPase subunit
MVSHALNVVANYVERIALVVEGGFRIGTTDQFMTEQALSEMYGIPVEVDSFDGHRIVVARRQTPETKTVSRV